MLLECCGHSSVTMPVLVLSQYQQLLLALPNPTSAHLTPMAPWPVTTSLCRTVLPACRLLWGHSGVVIKG